MALDKVKNICNIAIWTVILINSLSAQNKPVITPNSYKEWPAIKPSTTKLSYTGKYVAYEILNLRGASNCVYFRSTDNKWKDSLYNIKYFDITNLGSQEIGLALKDDSLWIITLGTHNIKLRTKVQSLIVSNANNMEGYSVQKSKWLIISQKDNSAELINTSENKSISLNSILQLKFLEEDETPIIRCNNYLIRVNSTLSMDTIFQFSSPSDYLYQVSYSNATQYIYLLVRHENQNKIIKVGQPNEVLFSKEKVIGGLNLTLCPYPFFLADNDSTLILKFSYDKKYKTYDPNGSSVVLWTYLDNKLSAENNPDKNPLTITYSFNLFSNKLYPLENDSLVMESPTTTIGEWVIVTPRGRLEDPADILRSDTPRPKLAISVKGRSPIPIKISSNYIRSVSPLGKYILYSKDSSVFVFTLTSQKYHEIFRIDHFSQDKNHNLEDVIIAGWSLNNDTVYFYHNNDIYMGSCTDQFPTKNLTNGYGAKHKIQFYFRTMFTERIIPFDDIKFILGIDKNNMDHGFYAIYPNSNIPPQKLESGPFYYIPSLQISSLGVKPIRLPIKARGSNDYLITRSSVQESPNLFSTKDFKHLIQLTHVNPESKYNWLRSELIKFNLSNGKSMYGVLYKPENFDSTKKYPLIICSYEDASPTLNAYIEPQGLANGCMPNVASYVSNGYLVFSPDVYRPRGNTYMGAVQTMEGALSSFSQMKQIDMEHIGIAGCSFSGHTTDFILTQINTFKAAVVSSAVANPISGFNMLLKSGLKSNSYLYGQSNFGVGLYKNKQLYINSSAILQADKIQTPLLLMHTTNDGVCPFYDALQFFVALRNLNKKVWLLEYKNGSHGVFGNDVTDFSERMRQFFDHYLKGMPAPTWMTEKTVNPWLEAKKSLGIQLLNEQQPSSTEK